MSWLKNSLLLMAGGALGLAVGAALSDAFDDEEEEKSISRLMEKIKREAAEALEKCGTEEEKEAVYNQVKENVQRVQAALQQKGEEAIEQLKETPTAESAAAASADESIENAPLDEKIAKAQSAAEEPAKAAAEEKAKAKEQDIKETMQELGKAFEELLAALDPKTAAAK